MTACEVMDVGDMSLCAHAHSDIQYHMQGCREVWPNTMLVTDPTAAENS